MKTKHNRTIAQCTTCHSTRAIVANGQCSSCYQRTLRGVPDIDCFALDPHSRRGQCDVMEGNCRLQKGHPCPFHRTHADYAESRMRAINRIRNLPEEQRNYITQTYLMQKEEQ